MNEFMKTLLSLSVSGTLLFLLIWGLKPLYKNKFSKRWQYYILAIAALRFIFPFTPDTTITGSLFARIDAAFSSEAPADQTVPAKKNVSYPNLFKTPEAAETLRVAETFKTTKTIENGTPLTDETANIPVSAVFPDVDAYACLFFLWFFLWSALTLMLFVRKITVYQGFISYIKAGSTEVSDIETLNLLSECEEKRNIRKAVELYRNTLITSPIMTGFFRPKIILPDRQIEADKLSYIFTHELIHYKRKDMFYKWLVQIVACLHWFNPFVYLLTKEISRTCELACDESVTASLDDNEKKTYGDALLSFLRTENSYGTSLASVTLTEGAVQLKERLGAIMDFHKKSKTLTALTILATIAVCACFTAIGAYAAPKAPQKAGFVQEQETEEISFSEQKTEEPQIPDFSGGGKDYEVFYYTQDGFYYDSYIIEMGWNLSEQASKSCPSQRIITLKDNTAVTAYFDDAVKEYIHDKQAAAAIAGLIYHLKNINTTSVLETPFITDIEYIGGKDITLLADEYYRNKKLCKFSAVFPLLDHDIQETCCQSIYRDGSTAFFSVVTKYMDKDTIMSYAEKADGDGNIAFFSILLNYMDAETIRQYAEKYYMEGNIAGFAVLTRYMTGEEKQEWLLKSQTDKKNTFHHVVYDALYD